jgi:glycosyltransferase involved in cell wall biosynthesis
MKEPLVSVIIPNYNYGRYLRQTLESVFSQTYKHLEVVVVDDGSKDDSEIIVKSYSGRVRFVQQKNQGVSAARNRGVKESTGELIAFLDADDLWLPTKLEKQIQRMVQDPAIGLVHCAFQEIDASGKPLEVFLEGMEGWVSREMLLFERPVVLATGSTGLVRRTTFENVGGFDVKLCTSADWDFCYRISRLQRIGFVPEPLILYRVHGSNMHANIKLMEHDVLHGYDKAFSVDAPDLRSIRRRSYSNAHMVLAGSYFRTGAYFDFARHAVRSLLYSPRSVTRILGFPKRWWLRNVRVGSLPRTEFHNPASTISEMPWSDSPRPTERSVSVIVPVKNEATSVGQLIAGLQKQTYAPKEIVVTDGGSEDATVEIIRGLQGNSLIPIILVEDSDAFPGRGRNLSVNHASNDWLACVDAGIVPEPDWLQQLVSTSKEEPDADLIQGRFAPVIKTYFDQCAAIAYVPAPETVTPFIASCLISRRAFAAVGGFREDLRSGEDLVFFRKLQAARVRRVVSKKALVHWELQRDIKSTFRRFATYSRYAMKAGLGADWQLRVSILYLCFLVFLVGSIFSWPLITIPFFGLVLRAQRRVFRWYAFKGKWRRLLEVINPSRVLTVTSISIVIDVAMFVGLFTYLRKDLLTRKRIGSPQPKEVGSSST